MVARSSPASRKRKLNVPSTSSNGNPAAKPSASMRKLAGSRYTRHTRHHGGAGAADGAGVTSVVEEAGGAGGADMKQLDTNLPPVAAGFWLLLAHVLAL